MATSTAVPTEVKKTAKKRVFDLEKFEKKTVEKEYVVPAPLTKVDEVLGLDDTKLLAYVNSGREREAWKEARNSIEGVSPKVINISVNAFRMYMFPELVERDANGDQTPESRKKHTQAIYAFIRATPQIIDSIKEAAKRAAASEDDEDEEEPNE